MGGEEELIVVPVALRRPMTAGSINLGILFAARGVTDATQGAA